MKNRTRSYSYPGARRMDPNSVEDGIQRRGRLEPGEGRADAEVDAPPEPEVLAHGVPAVKVIPLRAFEHLLVMVGGGVPEGDDGTGRNRHVPDAHVANGPPEQDLHGGPRSQRLLHGDGDQRAVCSHPLVGPWSGQEVVEQVAHQVGRGLDPSDEYIFGEMGQDLVVRQWPALVVSVLDERRHQVGWAVDRFSSRPDQLPQVLVEGLHPLERHPGAFGVGIGPDGDVVVGVLAQQVAVFHRYAGDVADHRSGKGATEVGNEIGLSTGGEALDEVAADLLDVGGVGPHGRRTEGRLEDLAHPGVDRGVRLAQVQLVRGPRVILQGPETALAEGVGVAAHLDDVLVTRQVEHPRQHFGHGSTPAQLVEHRLVVVDLIGIERVVGEVLHDVASLPQRRRHGSAAQVVCGQRVREALRSAGARARDRRRAWRSSPRQ